MGMKYNDRTGEFEEEKKGRNPSTVSSHTTSASSQPSRSSSSSSSLGSDDSGGCLSFISLFVLIVVGCAFAFICYQACSDTTGSSSSSAPQNVPSTYQNVNNAASDFSVSSDAQRGILPTLLFLQSLLSQLHHTGQRNVRKYVLPARARE